MKENKTLCYVMIVASILSFALALFLNKQAIIIDDNQFWESVFLSIFGGCVVGAISAIIYYNTRKSELLTTYTLEVRKIADYVMKTIHHITDLFPDEIILDMIAEDHIVVVGLDEEDERAEALKQERAYKYFVGEWAKIRVSHGCDPKKAYPVLRDNYKKIFEQLIKECSLCSEVDLSYLNNAYDQFDFVFPNRLSSNLKKANDSISRFVSKCRTIPQIQMESYGFPLTPSVLTAALDIYHELFEDTDNGFTNVFCSELYNLIEDLHGRKSNIRVGYERTDFK